MLYRLIPLRILRRTSGVFFDEMVPSDIPKIHGIDRVIHGPNSISPGSIEDNSPPVKRPWYMHPGQDDNLLVLQGTRYVDIYCPKHKETIPCSLILLKDIYLLKVLYCTVLSRVV